mmetsp:Transcript_27681/g.69085  ORF Transcript_27681/g.69085 Transcript_27681/m.69085 type:complete len:422 (+) Transcript_27681:281-1546(+)
MPAEWRRRSTLLLLLSAFATMFSIWTLTSLMSPNVLSVVNPVNNRTAASTAAKAAESGQSHLVLGATDQSSNRDIDVPQWVHDYVLLHAKALESPSEYSYLIYHCSRARGLCGGVADRLNGIVTLFYVAMVSNRIFLIDYSKPFPLNETLEEHLVQWSFASPGAVDHRIRSIDRVVPELAEPKKLPNDKRIIVVQHNLYRPHVWWKSAAIKEYLAAYEVDLTLSPDPPKQLYKWAFYTLFRKSRSLQQQLYALRRQLGLRQHDPYVGVHMRLGGPAVTWKDQKRHSLDDIPQFLECGERMQRMIASDGGNYERWPIIFVASDSYTAKKRIAEMDNSVRSANITLYHPDRSRSNGRGGNLANLAVYVDLFMLAQANCVVASAGGFTRLAIFISVGSKGPASRCSAFFKDCSPSSILRSIYSA